MEIKNFVMTDEGQVLSQLQPHLNKKLNPRRMSDWVTDHKVPADQQMPVIFREPGGVYRRFLHVQGLPRINKLPQLTKDIDVHNQKRAIMPLSGFEYAVLGQKPSDRYMAAWPAQTDQVLWVAGTYSLKQGQSSLTAFIQTWCAPDAGSGMPAIGSRSSSMCKMHSAGSSPLSVEGSSPRGGRSDFSGSAAQG